MVEQQLQEALEQLVYETVGNEAYQLTDEELLERIDACIMQQRAGRGILLEGCLRLRQNLFYTFRGYGMLSPLLADEEISEIMINNDGAVYCERAGKLFRHEQSCRNRKKLDDMIQKMVAFSKRKVNERNPIADARLPDGSRINIVLPPVAVDGPVVTIRKFPKNPYTAQALLENGTMDIKLAELFARLVREKKNLFIFGGTGSGKTTLLNVLTEYLGADERIITIEDSAELQIRHVHNLVRMEARLSGEELEPVSIRDMIKCALRMRPDRIIVGEVRGAESFDMLNAMNTGHEGSISTGHGNSAADMLMRLEMMIISSMEIPLYAVQRLIASAIDYLIEVRRFADGARRVCGVYRVDGITQEGYLLKTVFEYGVPADSGRDGRNDR